MPRLKITKTGIRTDKQIGKNRDIPAEYLNCQLDVPGVGRLRTGERHPDFHLAELPEELESPGSTQPVAAGKAD